MKPERDTVRNPLEKRHWWLHGRPAPDLRQAIDRLERYIATARLAKHRLFVYVKAKTLPDGQVVVFARNDDYFFGVLHSRIHEVWALRMVRRWGIGPRHTPTTTFETFPFPGRPAEPADDPRGRAIAATVADLVAKRDSWLSPTDAIRTLEVPAARPSRTSTTRGRRGSTWRTGHSTRPCSPYTAGPKT